MNNSEQISMQERSELEREQFIQNCFLEFVQSHPLTNLSDFAESKSEFIELLDPHTLHRLTVYRNGYYARVTSVMADAFLSRASSLVGKEGMEALLGHYFLENPASTVNMAESIHLFPNYLRLHSVHAEYPLLADLVEACLLRWKVLTGVDPTSSLSEFSSESDAACIYLQENSAFLASEGSIFDIWLRTECDDSENESAHEQRSVGSQAQGILFVKSQCFELQSILVPQELAPLVQMLSLRKSLAESIDELPEPALEKITSEMLQNWMKTAAECGAFELRN
jgi:hypothetical protein